MKRTILFTLVAALLLSANTQARVPGLAKKVVPKFTLGIKVGANMEQISGDKNWVDNAYNFGYMGGIFAGVTKNKIGLQVEGLVKSAQIDVKLYDPNGNNIGKATIKTISLDIPVLFEYKLFWHVWLQAGPQFSTFISAKQSSTDVKKNFNSANFAGVIGLQANLPARLSIGARYILGVTNINNESKSAINDAWNERSIQVSLGFRFL